MKKFAANINILAAIKIPLFLVMQGYNPKMSFDQDINLSANSTHKKIVNAIARSIANCIEEV